MYLRKLIVDEQPCVQAYVHLAHLGTSSRWWQEFDARVAAWRGLNPVGASLRLRFATDGAVSETMTIVAPAGQENLLRRYVAAFAWLEGIEATDVMFPRDQSEADRLEHDFPSAWAELLPVPLSLPTNLWLLDTTRLASTLGTLAAESQALGLSWSYQVNFRAFSFGSELRRTLGRNIIELRSQRGIPSALVAAQDKVMAALPDFEAIVEEIVAADDKEARTWLERAVARTVQITGSRPLEFRDSASLPRMLHSTLLGAKWSDQDLLSQAEKISTLHELALQPRKILRLTGSAPPPTKSGPMPPDASTGAASAPHPSTDPNPIFVSYRREELPLLAPVMSELMQQFNLPLWYDRGIPFGSPEWDTILEKKIQDARALLVFLGQGAVESRYCRREIKYADALQKPLLIILVGEVKLAHGLALTLGRFQRAKFTDADLQRKIAKFFDLSQVEGE